MAATAAEIKSGKIVYYAAYDNGVGEASSFANNSWKKLTVAYLSSTGYGYVNNVQVTQGDVIDITDVNNINFSVKSNNGGYQHICIVVAVE